MAKINHNSWLLILFFSFSSFQKENGTAEKSPLASTYSVEVLDKWMGMQIKLMSSTPAVFNGPFVRIYSYSGLAAYQSVYHGIPNKSAAWFSNEKLNQFPGLPQPQANKKYHWPSSLNTALAFMNRTMFPGASPENRMAIDSLENEIKKSFAREADKSTLERSAQFGKEIASAIFEWSEMDGYHSGGNNFSVASGPGKWKPTPPNYSRPIAPIWGSLRTMVCGSTERSEAPLPIPYSEDSTSSFYKEAKEVYDISFQMSEDQKQIALFWKEINPGFTAPGHWLNILRQILQKERSSLEKGVFSYAITGLAMNDAWISSWKMRYVHNVLRPVTYIREVMKHNNWLSFVPTPPHPEYTSGFAAMAGAVCGALAAIFGENYQLTDRSYADAGLGTRTFYSFTGLAREAGESKIYGGIHFRFSVDAGLQQGRTIANNIQSILIKKEIP